MSETVNPAYYDTVEIHDREFQKHSVDHRIYCIPVDEDEEERLVAQHRMIQELFDERLFFPPIQYPLRILDCGYGRASWALAMAQTYVHSEVTAIDIYPADLPEDQPDNLECEVWDLNHSLSPTYRRDTYDLINSRFVAPGIQKQRWPSYVRDLARLLKPGGWVQLVEYYYIFQSDSGRLTENHALQQWGNAYRWYMDQDRDPRIVRRMSELMRSARLVDVQEYTYRVPIGTWSTDAKERSVGLKNVDNVSEALFGHAIWPFTQVLGWTREQVEDVARRARAELSDPMLKLYIPLTVAWGRKR